jgi:basic amino acid/polyamine antiporter, APA family
MATSSNRKTLGLTGVTVSAMALIAPGAFLWMTFQLQAASTDASGATTAIDMWPGIIVALILAFLTALSFGELARRYPDSGSGSAYYFAEKAFLENNREKVRRWAKTAKFVTGWAAHLFYWVYPGVMVAFFTVLVTYLLGFYGLHPSVWGQIIIAWVFAITIGMLAMRGITGSTVVSVVINFIQLAVLLVFSFLAIKFRLDNPMNIAPADWFHSSAQSIVMPHSISGMLFQASIAIIILVGFESSAALASKAKNPQRDIPRGIILALVVQGLFAYLLEYFAANFAIGSNLTSADGALKGIAAAANSIAPIGDLAIQIGDKFLAGNGFAFMIVMAASGSLAIIGTTLSAMNTAVRITFAMAQDNELPEIVGLLHEKYSTPFAAVIFLSIFSGIVGTIGLLGGVVAVTGITLASNLGTFVLYGLICVLTIVAYIGTSGFNPIKHLIIPLLGLAANITLFGSIFVIGLRSGGTTAQATYVATGIAGGWLILSILYYVIKRHKSGQSIIPFRSQEPVQEKN